MKILGIGRNYAAHARELGNKVHTDPKEMVIFLKPASSLLRQGSPIVIPRGAEVHHEVELGVYIGTTGKNIRKEDAMSYVSGYCLALDMTARNWQNDAKKNGTPWLRAKGPDTFCPVSETIGSVKLPATMWLEVDGKQRQRGSTADMIWDIPELIAECSSLFTLNAGDLILTGTPEGVGPVLAGQVIRAGIEGVVTTEWHVVAQSKL
jgi:acylpyruvate hydrolase